MSAFSSSPAFLLGSRWDGAELQKASRDQSATSQVEAEQEGGRHLMAGFVFFRFIHFGISFLSFLFFFFSKNHSAFISFFEPFLKIEV